jgi:N-acetylneuraminate synthase
MTAPDGSRVFVIGEIGQAHEGSEGIAHSLIDAIAAAGCDAVKLQTHIAAAESSPQEPFRVHFSQQDRTRFDYWKRMEFSDEQWARLAAHARERKLAFISSPFSLAAVALLERVGVDCYKVGSGEVGNALLLDALAKTRRPLILSSGMSSYAELDRAVAQLSAHGSALSVLQCTTKYPTAPEDLGLNVLAELRARYGVPVGLSDHSGAIHPSIAAVALGATVLEVHVTFDKRMFGPDARASLTIDELCTMVEGVHYIERALQHPVNKHENGGFNELKRIFGKSLAVRRDMRAGEVVAVADLETKKPSGLGIPPSEYATVVGRKLKSAKQQWDFLRYEDLD